MSKINSTLIGATSLIIGGGLFYILFINDYVQPLPATRLRSEIRADRLKAEAQKKKDEKLAAGNAQQLSALPFQQDGDPSINSSEDTAWGSFTANFALFSSLTNQWNAVAGKLVDAVLPEWAKLLPENISKLQRELSMAPGSLADDIWKEAHDPYINPEIEYSASVRVSSELCDEEKDFLQKRKKVTTMALARYLGIPTEEVHPDDVPTIAMVGSGGGLRALVAGTGSLLASAEDGLFDCVTYTAGVSGSCWLQSLFHSSIGGRRLDKMVDHLKARIGVHIAYPPAALGSLNQAPTNKFLLSGFVEKLKGDPNAEFGLVDIYGLLLAARLLVPKGEIGVDDKDLKISNQRDFIKHGEHPMPIYTAIRHEIPIDEESSELEKVTQTPSEETKERARREAYFQWMEITPYEFFCEEFNAGIPTWSLGRKFDGGKDVPADETGAYLPEIRLPLLLGIFGSAFCATLSHYYREIKPLVKGMTGFGGIDEMIEGRNDDLSKVHPIDPATIPNFVYGMEGHLPDTTPEHIYKDTHLQLMDAGMSNNLPIYPLLRPGRDVDILIAFDASADIKTENWLSVADGYARQRGIKGWPLGVGWPKESVSPESAVKELDDAENSTQAESEAKINEAKEEQIKDATESKEPTDLGYCTVWVGTTQERSASTDDVPSKAVQEDWELMKPDAGIAVVYFPYMANPKVEGVDPVTSEYMSTWNFIYTPEDIDKVIALARANYEEGREQTRRCVRAVYERKKKRRLEVENAAREARWRRKVRLGIVGKKGEGDHFHLT
ncbi:FabD/lysophospholipase-like protein [Glarea lozoyensis ATCC 20868]|uniref:Lysophospholipase n=1 Tax=Glarea lozoyensis (strain ATCC 20868 / MF5171) TaxID=1116229 RepID=S3D7M8_GLAL2|nr:FabD/lysophospholipase-like protein [Glarea lozoyensis ATCC 20868]EPE33124.1 FabD/lysophospholipase-like protein [Glarea lozoyensis ATCC 20868]